MDTLTKLNEINIRSESKNIKDKLSDGHTDIFHTIIHKMTLDQNDKGVYEQEIHRSQNIFLNRILEYMLKIDENETEVQEILTKYSVLSDLFSFQTSNRTTIACITDNIFKNIKTPDNIKKIICSKGKSNRSAFEELAINPKTTPQELNNLLELCQKNELNAKEIRSGTGYTLPSLCLIQQKPLTISAKTLIGLTTEISELLNNNKEISNNLINKIKTQCCSPFEINITAPSPLNHSIFELIAKTGNKILFVEVVKFTIAVYGKFNFHSNDTNAINMWNEICKLQKSFGERSNKSFFSNTKINETEPGQNFNLSAQVIDGIKKDRPSYIN